MDFTIQTHPSRYSFLTERGVIPAILSHCKGEISLWEDGLKVVLSNEDFQTFPKKGKVSHRMPDGSPSEIHFDVIWPAQTPEGEWADGIIILSHTAFEPCSEEDFLENYIEWILDN